MNYDALRRRTCKLPPPAKKPDEPPKPAAPAPPPPPPPAPKPPHPFGPFEPYMDQLNKMENLRSVEFSNSRMWKLNYMDHPNLPFGSFEYSHLPVAGFGGGGRSHTNHSDYYRQHAPPPMSLQGPPQQLLALPGPSSAMEIYRGGHGPSAGYHYGPPPPPAYNYGPPQSYHHYGPPQSYHRGMQSYQPSMQQYYYHGENPECGMFM